MRVHYAVVSVSDMKEAVAFYRDTVGLPLLFESPGWSEFSTVGATLALHSAGPAPPGVCRPGFSVPSLEEFHKRMIERGVRCVQEPREVFGSHVAQYEDPDGLVFGVGEERR